MSSKHKPHELPSRPLLAQLLLGTAMLSALTSQPLWAQEAPRSTDPASPSLEEIVVTARRVEERLQAVPLSVTAMSAEQLQDRQISQVQDLRTQVSNVNTTKTSTPGGTQMSIRGMTSGGLPNISLDNRVGIYLDGVYIARSQGGSFTIGDIERVEVLKGPQGTLFGRNTTGGNVNFITATPTGQLGGTLEAGWGTFARQRYRATLNLPTVAETSVRLTYVHDENHGDLRNLASGRQYGPIVNSAGGFNITPRRSRSRLNGVNNDSFFAAVRYEGPENLTADYKFDYSRNTDFSTGGQTMGYAGNFVGCAGAAVALGLAANCATVVPAAFGGANFPVAVTSATSNRVPISFGRVRDRYEDFTSPTYVHNSGHSLTLNYDVSQNFRLRSITGYRRVATGGNFDLDGGDIYVTNAVLNGVAQSLGLPAPLPATGATPYCLSCSISKQKQRQFSQEFQAFAEIGNVDLLGGLYYFRERGTSDNFYVANFNPINAILGFGLPPLSSGVTRAPNTAFSNGDLTIARARSQAVFGRATWKATDKLNVVVGARYTEDRKRNTISPVLAALVDLDSNVANGVQNPPLTAEVNFSKFTYEGTVSYSFSPDVNVFARYATAYLSGGLLRNIPYRPETSRDIEAGLKSEWFNRRLRFNLTGFIQKSKDLQLSTNPPPFGTLVVINVGRQKTQGFELELAAAPIEGLTLSANAGYTDQWYSDAARDPAPKWTVVLGGAYDAPKFSNGSYVQIQLDANYRSKYYSQRFPLQNQQDGTALPAAVWTGYPSQSAYLTALDNALAAGDYWLANARLSLVDIPMGSGKARLSGFVRNIFDEDHLSFGANYGTQVLGFFEQPRSYGIDLRLEF